MPKLVVQHKGVTLQELELTGERVTLGRGEENTIKLDDNLVSREHVEIKEEGGRYLLSDLGSANGTYVGARKITRNYELKDGDIIKISPYTILFRLLPEEKLTRVGFIETGEKPTEIFAFSGSPRVLIRSGANVGKIYDLSNNPLIGRDPECDIELSEPSVSRRHARIQFIENKLIIMDVGSKTGTRVNGKLIDKPTPLKDGDRVQLGEVLLEVEWKGAPKAEVERPTLPYVKLEPVVAKKPEWWKWVVGIAAACIIVFGVWRLLVSSTQRADEWTKKTEEALLKGDFESAKRYAIIALEKDSTNTKAQEVKVKIHRVLAELYESEGDKARESGNRSLSNDHYNKAIGELNEILALNAADLEALRKKEELSKKLAILPPPPPPTAPRAPKIPPEATSKVPLLYDKALNAYRRESLEEAKRIIAQILPSDPYYSKAKTLKEEWIALWEEAKYYLKVIGDTTKALEKFKELSQKDPDNWEARAWLEKAPKWNSAKAKELFGEAERNHTLGVDYGNKPALAQAIKGYQEIVNMGSPPRDAPPEEWSIYNTAKERLGQQ